MRVVITGGGTGGHFYPLIAVVQSLRTLSVKKSVANLKIYYVSDTPYDQQTLEENDIKFVAIPAGKIRNYFSVQNFFDIFKMGFGVLKAIYEIYKIYPDVIFAKGGYASFPSIVAGFLLNIPVLVHESDSAPGRVTSIAGKIAKKVFVSYSDAMPFFKKEKVVFSGQPIRLELLNPVKEGANEFLRLEENIPTIVVYGGSSGAVLINEQILNTLPELLNRYQIIHQVGKANIKDIENVSNFILKEHPFKERYHPFGFLNPLANRMAGGAATIIITRAGSQLFEFAQWGVPAIVIPRTNSVNNHNIKNAYSYAHSGAGTVIEEKNLSSHILISEIDRIISDKTLYQEMKENSKNFYKEGASEIIASEILAIAEAHYK